MDVKVASKIGHALTRSLGGLSLADGSMLLRLRRASIALLGLVGAVGLGLVFFISQIGWPGVFSGPLPGGPTRAGTVHDAVALTRSGPAIATARTAAAGVGHGVGSTARRGSGRSGGSQLGHSRQLGAAGVRPGHGIGQPGLSQPESEPAPAPATPSPAPSATPTVASAPPATTSEPVKTSASTKASEAAVAKAVSDNSKSATATATKSQGQKSSKDQGTSSGSSKSSEASSAKAHRDEAVAKTKAKAPPPVATPEKSGPAPNPASAKEAADAAKANQAAH
jgi:hypothetical protein